VADLFSILVVAAGAGLTRSRMMTTTRPHSFCCCTRSPSCSNNNKVYTIYISPLGKSRLWYYGCGSNSSLQDFFVLSRSLCDDDAFLGCSTCSNSIIARNPRAKFGGKIYGLFCASFAPLLRLLLSLPHVVRSDRC
jgi:hypothetical protein